MKKKKKCKCFHLTQIRRILQNLFVYLFVFLAYTTNSIFAQQISIHSPTAANLGLYGEIPVSYYTGTPDISIPLHEIKGKQVSVPVRLTYHPTGIRPEIHPGTVGLGWSLQAGGVISRTVRGNSPDESKHYQTGSVDGYLQYTGTDAWIAQNNWKDNDKNATENNCLACRNAVWNTAPNSDLVPDEFSFSFMNISGKFYFDHTGQIQVQCDNPVKVIFNNEFIYPWENGIELNSSSNSHRAFKSFIIIDEYGTQYYFGGASAIEFSDPITYRNSNGNVIPASGMFLHATSWFLTQIKSADGADIINFEYERGPFVSQLYRSVDSYHYNGAQGSGDVINSITKDGTFISPVYLTRIIRINGEVIALAYSQSNDMHYIESDYTAILANIVDNFPLLEATSAIPRLYPVPNNKFDRIQWLKLDTISVKNTVDESIRQINFSYNNNSSERLFLDSLKIKGVVSSASSINYAFTYKNRNMLPTYLTCPTDHWGFNNGKTYWSSDFDVQKKAPDASYTDSGVLSKITYPTGGKVNFEYELHDYAKVVNKKSRSVINNQTGTASGLRIKKITADNLTGDTITRAFFYKQTPTSSSSSGILNMLPQYTYTINGTDCDNKSFSISGTRSMPIIPLTKDNEGIYIGYTYVCEQISNANGGYTQYNYTNHDNGYTDNLLTNGTWHRDIFQTDPHCSRYFERGRLKKETTYNSVGQAVAIQETVWDRYGSQGEDNPRAYYFEGLQVGYDYCSSVAYLYYCYKFLPSQTTKTVYDFNGQNPVVTTTNYEYNTKNLVKTTSITNSDASVFKQELKYPSDYTTAPYTEMVTKNMLSTIIEQISNQVQGSVNKEIERIKTDYIKNATRTNNLILPDKVSSSNSGASNLRTDVTYDFYDSKGNVLQYTSLDGLKTVYLWGYNYQYPIAKIENATYSDVCKKVGNNSETTGKTELNNIAQKAQLSVSDTTVINNLRVQLPNAQVTTYLYKPLIGLQTVIDPRGVKITYHYDSFGRLHAIKDESGKLIENYNYNYKNQ